MSPDAPDQLGVPPLSRAELRELDRRASTEFAVPTIILMENAAIGLAEETTRLAHEHDRDRFLVVCGPGNNGGDGFAAARHLDIQFPTGGHNTRIVRAFSGNPKTDNARTNADACAALGIPGPASGNQDAAAVLNAVSDRDAAQMIVIDALLGTGPTSPVRPAAAGIIHAINRLRHRGALVVAADIPSGLDADTGVPLGACVTADLTVTFAAPKLGFFTPQARQHTGRVVLRRIGVPDDIALSLARERG